MNLQDMFGLDGRIALVTGGSRGIGKMIVEGYLAAGCARVYISARKTAQIEEAVADFETRYPGKVIGLPVDLSTVEGCRALAKELEAREEKLDILVNNAGAAWGEPFENFPEAGWDKVMDINVKSPFFLVQALAPLLRSNASAENTASIINIGSIAGIIGNGLDNFSYAASKTAIHQLTRILSTELAKDHIRVNAIAPGRFYSKMTEFLSSDQKAFEDELKTIPMRRWGEASDIAGVAIMLASQAGAFITGQVIPVDGGTSVIN